MRDHLLKADSVDEEGVNETSVKEEEVLKEISLNAEGAPHVHHNYIRLSLGQLWPEGFERPCVARWPNCSYFYKHAEEDTFNRGLKLFFIAILTLAVINIFVSERITRWLPYYPLSLPHGLFQIVQGIALLAIFAALVAVSVHMKKMTKSAGPAAQRKDQLQTISGLVEQLKPTKL